MSTDRPGTRPRIFYVLSQCNKLDPLRGDQINELYFLQGLAVHFDVFYNGVPFDPGSFAAGDENRPIAPPEEPYDLYIVRNNPGLFLQLPSPRVALAYPYNSEVFAAADAVLTFTERWRSILQDWNDHDTHGPCSTWYPNRITAPQQVVNIGQIPSTLFHPHGPEHPTVRRYRLLFSNPPFVIGYFGRVDAAERLPVFFEACRQLEAAGSDHMVVVGSSYSAAIPDSPQVLHVGGVPYSDMPFASAACDLTVSGEDPAKEWAGDRKAIESIAAGVPALTMPWSARIEQLGEGYPLYYETPADLAALVTRFRQDHGFRARTFDYIDGLRRELSLGSASETLARRIRPLLRSAPEQP